MAKRSLLLVDGDARSLRVLEVSLRKAGFVVTTAVNGRDGLEKARIALPDLILSDTDMPEMDGFELCRAVKADPELARVPFVFLTGQTEIENKIRGLELGVDEYLTKPIYIKEILTRIRLLLQKKQRDTIETRRDSNTRFAGTLHDMGVVDLIQTIEVGRKSGLIHFSGADGRQGTIYFRNGAVIDAEAGHLQGADAVYRLLTWSEGEFELLLRTVRRNDSIDTATPGLLMEGMRRLDEWGRLLEQLPPLTTRFEVDVAGLAERLADLPDELNHILRLFDGRRSVLDVLDLARVGDLECLELVSRLYFEELLHEVDGTADAGDSGSDLALEGWLGRKIPPTSELPILEPAPGEIATDAAAEWDSSEGEPSVEEVWPNLAGGQRDERGADGSSDDGFDDDEGPTPPSSRAPLTGMAGGRVGVSARAEASSPALGRIDLVRRESGAEDGPARAAAEIGEAAPRNGASGGPGSNGARGSNGAAAGTGAGSASASGAPAGAERGTPGRDPVASPGGAVAATGSGLNPAVSIADDSAEEGARAGASTVPVVDPPATGADLPDEPRVEFRPSRSTGSFRALSSSDAGTTDAAGTAGVTSAAPGAAPLAVEGGGEPASRSPSDAPPAEPSIDAVGAGRAPAIASGLDRPPGRPGSSTGDLGAAAGPQASASARPRTPSGGFAVVPPGDPSSASGRLHALSLGRDDDEPAPAEAPGPRDTRPGSRTRSPSGGPPVGSGGAVGSVAVSVPGGLAGAGTGGSITAAASRITGGGTSLLGRATSALRPPPRPSAVGSTGLEGVDQSFDTSDRTPLPDPVPLGEERSNPGIKSSLGAEVATVSGELAARRYPRLTDEVGREMVGVAPLHGDHDRGERSRSGDPRLGRSDLRPSVELDQELSAAAEVVQVLARRRPSTASGIGSGTSLADDEVTRPRRRAVSLGAVGGDEVAMATPMPLVPAQAPRVSSMLRAASGRPFARTFVVTVAAATLVGALFGLLFWWLGSRDPGSVVAGPAAGASSPGVVEPGGRGAPVGSGGGSLPDSQLGAALPVPSPEPEAHAAATTSGEPSAAPAEPSAAPAEVLGAADYDQLFEQARQARRRRDYAAALDLAGRAGRLQPTVQARTLEAEALLGLGETARALSVVDDAVQMKRRHAPAWYIKGRIHRALGQADEARAAFNEYLRLDPEGSRADQVIDILQDM